MRSDLEYDASCYGDLAEVPLRTFAFSSRVPVASVSSSMPQSKNSFKTIVAVSQPRKRQPAPPQAHNTSDEKKEKAEAARIKKEEVQAAIGKYAPSFNGTRLTNSLQRNGLLIRSHSPTNSPRNSATSRAIFWTISSKAARTWLTTRKRLTRITRLNQRRLHSYAQVRLVCFALPSSCH